MILHGFMSKLSQWIFLGLRDAIFDNYDGKVIFLFQEPFTFDPHLEKKISLILKPFTPYFEPSTTIPLALNCSSPPPFYLNLTSTYLHQQTIYNHYSLYKSKIITTNLCLFANHGKEKAILISIKKTKSYFVKTFEGEVKQVLQCIIFLPTL